MEDHERIVREVLKLLPDFSKALGIVPVPISPRRRISLAQVKTLIHLAQYGPQPMGELARGLQISTPSATSLINPLVDSGWVVRRRDEIDHRVIEVSLSARAQELADNILASRRAQVEEAMRGLSAEAQENFLMGLTRLAQAIGET